ncbi:MAG: hypothetical protein ACI4VF_10420 [Lachnospirales bacterium]
MDNQENLIDNSVEITCPQCKNDVVIGDDNICPVCGCEFEEIEKKFRLTKLGIFVGILSVVIYMFVLILTRFINSPKTTIEGSLFHMDAFRFGNFYLFLTAIFISLFIAFMFLLLNFIESKKLNIIITLLIVFFGFLNMGIFYYAEGNRMFYILTKMIALLPVGQVFGGICCFFDIFIKPKSKL